ncbi:MAG TPA: molybdate ABC transporter permease subunit [Thermomicrobiales bacterium]|nr:molybdate ABC transporter permease subunit [Thermomicrobiales bacterium]
MDSLTEIDWFPVYLSLQVATLATLVAVSAGIPLAWFLARHQFPGKRLLEALILLPIILPPTVLGYYLLRAIGRQSALGGFIEGTLGVEIIFTWKAAVLASTIVAIPLVMRAAQSAFETVDPTLEAAARTLGRSELSIFLTITAPLAWRGILAGTVLGFARAMGEFGATLMVAGNIPGRTQTLPIAIYDAVQAGRPDTANTLVLLLSLLAVAVLVLLGRLSWGNRW